MAKSAFAKLGKIVDGYNLKARQFPVTVALAPVIVAALAAIPELRSLWGFLGSLVAGLGLPYVLAQAAGEAGKRLEPSLYEAWGGMPSVAMLRHRDTRIDPITKASYFEVFRSVSIQMPTIEEEERNPADADRSYQAACAWLRKETRDDKKYPRVKTELTNYGLARNLLGIRWPALAAAFCALTVQAVLIAMPLIHSQKVEPFIVLSLGFNSVMACFWLLSVSVRWARRTADAYALALLEACDKRKSPSTPRKRQADPKSNVEASKAEVSRARRKSSAKSADDTDTEATQDEIDHSTASSGQ